MRFSKDTVAAFGPRRITRRTKPFSKTISLARAVTTARNGVPNQLSMAIQEMILSLHRQGWSKRKIARELGLHRNTVRRCVISATAQIRQEVNTGSDEPQAAHLFDGLIFRA